MTLTSRVLFVLLWLASIAVVGTLVSAQTRRDPAPIISGTDLGFRAEGWNGQARTGTWMVRIDGRWVEAQSTIKPMPATTR
jgi:hypothetical protein